MRLGDREVGHFDDIMFAREVDISLVCMCICVCECDLMSSLGCQDDQVSVVSIE